MYNLREKKRKERKTSFIEVRNVTVILVGNGIGDPSSNLDEAVYISQSANTLGKL